ncbi:MAG: BglG family transcription antiterminator [Lachnospiraceae bacterium]|nr:BglG family transcription antiterminator [Lachnospiraceae bacterium]
MEFTSRLKQILSILLKEQEAMPVKILADRMGISKRTVQRELEAINYALKDYEVSFMSKTGVGVWLEGSSGEKERLLTDISSGDNYDVTNREERRKRLILEILKEKGLKKLFYYSSQFGVSEATISSDLDAAGEWLSRFGLLVIRRPGSGITIEGSEENYRRAIRAFINENMDTRVVREAYENVDKTSSSYESLKRSSIGQLLDDDIMMRTRDCIMGMENARVLTLTENSYVGLIIHISIAINRILKNEVIEPERGWLEGADEDEDYRLAKDIVKELEEEFEIHIPEVEISYICLHIKGAKHEKIRVEDKNIIDIENKEIKQLVNEMIDTFDADKAYLIKQDDEFIQGLLAHLQPTLIRLQYGMQIQNPVLEDIRSHYPEIYARCEKVAEVLQRYTGKRVPEEETGYLTVHFGAALVRLEERKEKIRKVSIGVVCSSGIGISRLMSSKLLKVFRDRVSVTAYGKNDITPFVASKVDFFVSSIPMEQMETPVLFVNPLLNAEDMQKIQQMVYKYERIPLKQKEEDVFSRQLEEINLVAAQIRTVIKYLDFFKVDNRITFEELLIAVGERMSPYSDRRDLIREDILRREQIATQVFAELGFALLHACTKGVVRPEFAVCMTRDLDAYRDPYFKGIKFVFIMLVPEDENLKVNRDIMGYISSMLIEDYEFLDIAARGNQEEIRSAVSRNLKKYFNKYLSELS